MGCAENIAPCANVQRIGHFRCRVPSRKAYETSVNEQRDHLAILQAAEKKGLEEGRKEGIKEGRKEVALVLLKQGLQVNQISEATGLSDEEVLSLRK